jgi:putative endonuclease
MAKTEKRRLGDIGENIACEFLTRRGYAILDRNYLRKWGELDIVAKKNSTIHFVEVKSVSCVTQPEIVKEGSEIVAHVTDREVYRPEENLHPAKLKRLVRTMQLYMLEKNLVNEFQLDLITVKIDEKARKGRAELIENVIVS